jgi:hypothetical protein
MRGRSAGRDIMVSALGLPVRITLAMGGTGHAADLQLHQAFSDKAVHLVQNARIRAFCQQIAHAISWSVLVGSLGQSCDSQPNPTQVHAVTASYTTSRDATPVPTDRFLTRRPLPSLPAPHRME